MDKEILKDCKIPTEEVEQDIKDTENEIIVMKREVEAFRMLGDRMSMFKADARVDGIIERERFIEQLKELLEYRKSLEKGD
jgi:hypothetical protein